MASQLITASDESARRRGKARSPAIQNLVLRSS